MGVPQRAGHGRGQDGHGGQELPLLAAHGVHEL